MRLMIDTNVALDLLSRRAPFFKNASLIKILGFAGEAEIWVPAKSFTDIFYIMKKDFPSDAIQELFLENLSVLKACSLDEADIRAAAVRSWPDFEDCLVAVAAEKVKADFLLTRDKHGFEQSQVPACSPEEFFEKLEIEYGLVYEEIDF